MAQKLRPQAETLSGSPQPNFTGFQVSSVIAKRAPTTLDTGYALTQVWLDKVGDDAYILADVTAGVATWNVMATTPGNVDTLTASSGGALTPSAGNINLLGTANQITTAGAGSTITFTLPASVIAPGSITSTTSLTATLGNITATNGNFVASTAGSGLSFNANVATGAASGPVVLNSRAGRVIFTSVTLPANSDITLTITNSQIINSSTQVIYSMVGANTGAALSIKSITNSAGSVAIIVTNGVGATTSVADIQLTFLVLN